MLWFRLPIDPTYPPPGTYDTIKSVLCSNDDNNALYVEWTNGGYGWTKDIDQVEAKVLDPVRLRPLREQQRKAMKRGRREGDSILDIRRTQAQCFAQLARPPLDALRIEHVRFNVEQKCLRVFMTEEKTWFTARYVDVDDVPKARWEKVAALVVEEIRSQCYLPLYINALKVIYMRYDGLQRKSYHQQETAMQVLLHDYATIPSPKQFIDIAMKYEGLLVWDSATEWNAMTGGMTTNDTVLFEAMTKTAPGPGGSSSPPSNGSSQHDPVTIQRKFAEADAKLKSFWKSKRRSPTADDLMTI
eukprot:PhF_6_TR17345/c0_g1_i1/m.26566